MSLTRLIDNCVPPDLRHLFAVADRDSVCDTELVFVAALYSGKSRLAFQALVSWLSALTESQYSVLLIDDQSEMGARMSDFVPKVAWGCGSVFERAEGLLRFIGSGADLSELRTKLMEVN